MSHLTHIVNLKKDLINQGITNVETQIEIAQTTYVKALITVLNSRCVCDDDRAIFIDMILSYWNEVTPVKGSKVKQLITKFHLDMSNFITHMFTSCVLKLVITPKVETTVDVDYTKLPAYESLIVTLIDEANKKYDCWVEQGFLGKGK